MASKQDMEQAAANKVLTCINPPDLYTSAYGLPLCVCLSF